MPDSKKNDVLNGNANDLSQEIEEWKNKYEELEKFSYTVTHDLKAPLRAINNLSKWIEEDLGENASEEVVANMKMLRSRIERMQNLIQAILNYSKAGRISAEKENVNLNELIAEIIETLSPPKNIFVKIPENLPTLHTEKIALEQVFQNLLSNAVKFHRPEGGKIEIAFMRENDSYEFSVADDGMGIEAEFHEKVFEPFQTLQSKDKVEGSGIGLAIVKKIVESRGGEVHLFSEKNKGVKITFTWQ